MDFIPDMNLAQLSVEAGENLWARIKNAVSLFSKQTQNEYKNFSHDLTSSKLFYFVVNLMARHNNIGMNLIKPNTKVLQAEVRWGESGSWQLNWISHSINYLEKTEKSRSKELKKSLVLAKLFTSFQSFNSPEEVKWIEDENGFATMNFQPSQERGECNWK